MSAVVSISVQVPDVESALDLLAQATAQIRPLEAYSIVGVHVTDQTQPPF